MFVSLLGEKWPALASLSREKKHLSPPIVTAREYAYCESYCYPKMELRWMGIYQIHGWFILVFYKITKIVRAFWFVKNQSFDLFVYVSYSNQTLWGAILKSSQVVLLEPPGSCWNIIQITKESKCKISISIVNPSVPVWKLTIEHHYEKKG